MLAESVILSILLGVLRGKKISSLEKIKIDKPWLVILSFVMEFICGFIIKNGVQPFSLFLSENFFMIHILIYIPLFLFFVLNSYSKYLNIVLFGIVLNFIVIVANNGFMPVSVEMAMAKGFKDSISMLSEGKVAGHALLVRGETRFWMLSDIINIPPPYPFPQTISIGDIFISLGAFLFIQSKMKRHG